MQCFKRFLFVYLQCFNLLNLRFIHNVFYKPPQKEIKGRYVWANVDATGLTYRSIVVLVIVVMAQRAPFA